MENQGKTLASVMGSQGLPVVRPGTQSFTTFLTVYSLNLVHRFPDITDLNAIDYTVVQGIAEFSAACSSIALEYWENLGVEPIRQRSYRPASRSA